MTSVHSQSVGGPLRRVPALASALLLTLLWGAVGPAFPPAAQAETFSDPGFTAEVVTTLPPFLPVGVTWASDGRLFIWQRNGVIRIYKNGQLLATPFLDLSANVNTFDDRGMLGLALHPNFLANGSVYVSYVREDGGDPNDSSPKLSRLSRFTADPQTPDVALAASETVLLTIPNDLHQHLHGTLRFGADGRLFMGHGDDSSSSVADVHSFVAQDLTDLRGKLLRLTEDGTAPGDNPFDDGTNSIRSKIYSYGLRNPFRFTLHPVSGEPYIGDVGWNAWEELNRGRGKNFGWPCYEGVNPQPLFQAAFPAQCAPLTPDVVTAPLLTYPLAGTPAAAGAPMVGNTTIGGPFYTATLYPEVYRGNWFITDYVAGWIRRLVFDGAGTLTGTVPFATGLSGPVDLELGPDGLLYYVSIVTGQVKRIRYNGPAAVAAATPSSGLSPLTVNFSSAGSSDPNSGPVTYLWDFGDGQTSPDANPVHVYPATGVQTFTATLTVTTSTNQHAAATVKVTVGSRPPTATIQAPITGTPVVPGQTITYQGSAIDPEDGPMPSAGLKWIILLHHTDHTHTQLFTTGPTGSAVIQNHGVIGTFSYEFQLTATDASGLTHTTSVTLPVLGDTTPPSDPTGLVALAATGHITLTWTAATDNGGLAGYRVERCQGAGCTSFVQIATPTSPSYTDPDLLLATPYSYRVRATDATGNLSLHSSNVASATSSATPLGLVTAYGMDEGSGTTLADASGSGHTGTLVNGPAWVTSQATYGQALAFDGLDDAVSVATPATYNFGTADFTIEMWLKRAALGGAQRHLFSKCAPTTWVTGCKELYFTSSNQVTFGSFATGGTVSSTIADTNWHHIAVTFTDANNLLNLYVDGALATTATKDLEADGAGHVVMLGNLFGSNPFSGVLDDVRLYRRALTLAEIQADKATPLTPPDTTPPSDVTGVTATAVNATQITLSWAAATDNIGVTGYQVERCQGVSCTTFVPIATSAGTTFGDSSLAASTSYRYRVKATDAATNVSVNYSNVASAATPTPLDTMPPSDVSGLIATAASSSQITLSWTASTDNVGVTGYRVERCQGVGCTTFVQFATPTTNSYSDAGLTAGTSYRYRVKAVDVATNLSLNYSNTASATPIVPPVATLVTAYGMNEGSGTTLTDASGSGHTGTLVNGPAWVAGQATYGQALSFDGLDDAVSVATPATYNFGTADFTIEMWMKRAALGGAQRHLFSKCAPTTWVTGCKELYVNPSNQLTFGSFATGGTVSSTIADTNWHHIAVTFTDATNLLNIYVDGALVTTATKALEADGAGHVVTLGNLNGSYSFSGMLDDVRLYSRVLTLAEIQADRATPITPPDTIPPGDVTGLTATAVSATQINLSWTAASDNVGVTGYQVERCQGAGCTSFVPIATPTSTTLGNTGLTASTTYRYRVKAVDAATNVSVNYSNVASAATPAPPDTIPPSDPTGLTATAAGSSQITLSWIASTDSGGSSLAGYRVERCQGAGCTTFVQIATPALTSYSDPGLIPGTSYSYRVRATDGAGNLSLNYSNTTSVTPSPVTTLVTAYGMNEGSGTTLADASGSGHTGTLVNGPAWVAGQATYGQALSFDGLDDAVSVANPVTYNFGTADFTIELWVKRAALGGAQRHLFSKCAAVIWEPGCKELYVNPSNQLTFGSFATGDTVSSTIADTNWHHIAVTFTDATNLLNIYVDGALVTTATKALEADGAGHVVTLGNLNGSYSFSGVLDDVRLYSRALTLAEIQADRATPITPPDTIPPGDVTGLTATAVSATQLNLSWTAASDNVGVTGYQVERCQGAGCTSFVPIATPTGTTLGNTGLTASTTYRYRVKAVDAATNVSVNYSNVASAATPAVPDTIPPSDPTGLTATAAGSSQITLSWIASTDSGGSSLAGYRVERCQGAGCTAFVQIATPALTSYSDPGLIPGTSYSYRVRATDGAGNLSLNYSNTTSVTPSPVTTLVTAYGMNEGSGTTLADASGSGHTGTLVNGPAWVAGQATYGQALSFDGLDDAVSVATPVTYNFGTADFTIEMWLKRAALGGAQRHLFSKCAPTTWVTGCKELYVNPSNQLTFGSFATGDTVSSTIADTNWHHIAVTFTDATNLLNIYVDGALVTTATKALEADGAGHVVTVGNLFGSYSFSGVLDDVRLYSRALTLAEIQADRATPLAPPVTNLMTAYAMNEGSGTTLADASGSGHTGTLVNGPAWVAGQATYGQALSFDGLDDAVSVANPVTYNFGTADFTIEMWLKRAVLGGAQRHLFSKCAATTWEPGCKELYVNPSNQLTFGSFATGGTVSSTIADTNWHHIAVTFTDATNLLNLYVDGALVTTATEALEADGTGHVVTLGNLNGSYSFSGVLDDVRLYSRALTLAEIQADRATPITPPVTTLMTAYAMNEGSGTTLADTSVSGHTGTLVNGPAWVAGQATYGQALSFDGLDDVVSVANPVTYNFGTADFTIELWVKRNVLGGAQRHLFSKCAAVIWEPGCKELYFNPSNQLIFGSFSTGDTVSSTIADTNWHHIAVTFTDATNLLNIYVDGALITTATKALEADSAGHVVTLGNLRGRNPFSGLLDDVRIYNRVLTLAEIQTDMNTPVGT